MINKIEISLNTIVKQILMNSIYREDIFLVTNIVKYKLQTMKIVNIIKIYI
jgi:hypothetical protein